MTRNRQSTIGSRGRRAGRALLVSVGVLGFAGCTDWAGYDLDYFWDAIPALSTMRGSVAYDPYDLPRLPAPNSVPFSTPNGDIPAAFAQTQLDSAAATLTNPFAGNTDAAVLARGQAVYRNQCAACHGPEGAGNGPVVGPGKYPFAPPISGAATAGRSDGYIYAVIVAGRGLMPPYGEKMTHSDRWATVSYVRQLQGGQAGGASAAAPVAPAATVTTPAAPAAPAPADTSGQAQQQ